MPDETSSSAGARFSADLRQIREERGISIGEIHDSTRIARTLIESFEEGRLYDHPTYNRVYLRSFVEAYAEAVDISPAAALAGLDAALEGSYEHDLAAQYLESSEQDRVDVSTDQGSEVSSDSSDVPSPSSGGAPTAGGPEGRGGIVGPPRAVGGDEDAPELGKERFVASAPEESQESSSETTGKEISGEGEAEEDDSTSSPPETDPVPTELEDTEPSSSVEDDAHTEAEPGDLPSWSKDEEEDEDGAESSTVAHSNDDSPAEPAPSLEGAGGTGIVGEPTKVGEAGDDERSGDGSPDAVASPDASGSSSAPESTHSSDTRSRQVYVTGFGIVLLVLVLFGLGVAYLSSEESGEEAASSVPDTTVAAAQSDTTVAEEAASEDAGPPPADLTLGERLHVTVVATSNVSDMRIRRDSDLRRPYWIQEGEAAVFPFRQQITLENELSDVELFVEGYPFPLSSEDTLGSVEITRSEVEAFADTLRGEPTTLTVPQDTIPAGGPAGD